VPSVHRETKANPKSYRSVRFCGILTGGEEDDFECDQWPAGPDNDNMHDPRIYKCTHKPTAAPTIQAPKEKDDGGDKKEDSGRATLDGGDNSLIIYGAIVAVVLLVLCIVCLIIILNAACLQTRNLLSSSWTMLVLQRLLHQRHLRGQGNHLVSVLGL